MEGVMKGLGLTIPIYNKDFYLSLTTPFPDEKIKAIKEDSEDSINSVVESKKEKNIKVEEEDGEQHDTKPKIESLQADMTETLQKRHHECYDPEFLPAKQPKFSSFDSLED